MQDGADATGLFGGGAMSLTLRAQRTQATVGETGRVEHPKRSIVFGTPLPRIERCILGTAQRVRESLYHILDNLLIGLIVKLRTLCTWSLREGVKLFSH